MNTAELLVKCLENEGVKVVFGIPGEENLAVMNALARSNIRFITVRHRAGCGLYGGRLRSADGPRRRLPSDARSRRNQPHHRRGRRQFRRRAAGRHHRAGFHRQNSFDGAPVSRFDQAVRACDQAHQACHAARFHRGNHTAGHSNTPRARANPARRTSICPWTYPCRMCLRAKSRSTAQARTRKPRRWNTSKLRRA